MMWIFFFKSNSNFYLVSTYITVLSTPKNRSYEPPMVWRDDLMKTIYRVFTYPFRKCRLDIFMIFIICQYVPRSRNGWEARYSTTYIFCIFPQYLHIQAGKISFDFLAVLVFSELICIQVDKWINSLFSMQKHVFDFYILKWPPPVLHNNK